MHPITLPRTLLGHILNPSFDPGCLLLRMEGLGALPQPRACPAGLGCEPAGRATCKWGTCQAELVTG